MLRMGPPAPVSLRQSDIPRPAPSGFRRTALPQILRAVRHPVRGGELHRGFVPRKLLHGLTDRVELFLRAVAEGHLFARYEEHLSDRHAVRGRYALAGLEDVPELRFMR